MIRKLCLSLITLFALAGGTTSQAEAPVPSLMFTALETGDLERAEAFYINAIGMKRVMRISPPGASATKDAFNFSGNPLAAEPLLILAHHDATDPKPVSPVLLGMRVADAHAAAAQVRAAGYEVLREPAADDHGPRLTTLVKDPDGNIVELVQLDYSRMK